MAIMTSMLMVACNDEEKKNQINEADKLIEASQKNKNYNDQYHDDNNVSLQFAKDLEEEEIIGKTANEIKEMFYEWSSDERKFSPKLFKEAVWDLYQIGIGRGKVGGKTKRVFMRQDDTNQKLMH